MSVWAENNNVLTDLQNGFRADRCLEYNLFMLIQTIVTARKESRNLPLHFLVDIDGRLVDLDVRRQHDVIVETIGEVASTKASHKSVVTDARR
ncbi:hypothetical protein MRX96_003069 [Rhipicephalus microplus]